MLGASWVEVVARQGLNL